MKKIKYSEEELVALLQQKDVKAFSYLYDNYAPGLLGVIMRLLPNQATAEDVLQNVFIKIWKGIQHYDSARGRLYTWMIGIAMNAAIDHAKSKQEKKEKVTGGIEEHAVSVDRVNFSSFNPDVIGLREHVDNLKDEFRILIDAIYFNGNTHEETAEVFGLPLGTVKTRLRAAMNQLRQKMN